MNIFVVKMNDSWHYKYFDGSSVIEEMIKLLDEDRVLLIYTDSDCFIVSCKNTIEVGEGAMMIGSDDVICMINTNKITHLELHRSKSNIKKANDSKEEQ